MEDQYKCLRCGEWTSSSEMYFLSHDPYSELVCGECFEKWIKEKNDKGKEIMNQVMEE